MRYDGLNSSNTSHLSFNVTSQSDFEHIMLTCIVVGDKSPPCSNITAQNNNCLTTFNVKGTLGCDYECFFTTEKTNYTSSISHIINLTVCEYLFV